MVKNQNEITIGRRTAGYALTMFRNNVKESELISGYLANTKKEIDPEMCVCLWHWLKKIYPELPERTKTAWGGAGDGRKGFFNWLYQLKNMQAFRAFAFEWLQEQEKEAAALSAQSAYGQNVDYSGFSDLADYDPARVKSDFESWLLSGAGVPVGDNGDISRGAGLSADAPAPGVYNFDAPF